MKVLTIMLALLIGSGISILVPNYGAPAVLFCTILALLAGFVIYRQGEHREFLLLIFVNGLLIRMLLGTLTFTYNLQNFFASDAELYDRAGYTLLRVWLGELSPQYAGSLLSDTNPYRGMLYMMAAIYGIVGRNVLAVQFVNAIIGAATAVVIFLCAHHIFQNLRVARIAAFIVAFFPSLVLWSSQALKDAPIIFLLSVAMLATLKLGEKWSVKYFIVLVGGLLGVLGLRFYIFYMVVVAVGGAFIVGMRTLTAQSFLRQFVIIVGVGLAMTYLGVLRTGSNQLETLGNLETVQRHRSALSSTAQSGFGADVDVSTTSGAIRAVPIGLIYLLFAPFPWQLANLRQSITLPEMLVWWSVFPLLVLGLWFTIKYRLRQALPILLFTSMLTLAYAVYQGNVGTAYRQRAQLLVFYFIFVAVGIVLLRERIEDRKRTAGLSPVRRTPAARRSAHNES
jgi:4-amino-4-deoxy-L-arabinose transferase-like glycosyltransferase